MMTVVAVYCVRCARWSGVCRIRQCNWRVAGEPPASRDYRTPVLEFVG